MIVRHLKIRNFRGIKELDWTIKGKVVCLIGAGDSTKTTVLDAIESALSPRWNIPFSDSDFYNGEIDNPIEIEATVGYLPKEFISDDKYGLKLRGWTKEGQIRIEPDDEPDDEDEDVITIRLRVDKYLEPEWTVINDREPEGTKISWRDRQKLGVNRLGPEIDRHLSWARGTPLYGLLEEKSSISQVLSKASREARRVFDSNEFTELKDSIQKAIIESKTLGVSSDINLAAGLDTKLIHFGMGAISLFDGSIPLRLAGLATRRLIALGLEKLGVKEGAIILIDEFEYALEPYRIRNLLMVLKKLFEEHEGNLNPLGQIIISTHSPIVAEELKANELNIVKNTNGKTTILNVDNELQGVIRACSESLFSKKIIVCEGKTEFGICKALQNEWVKIHDNISMACLGACLVEGEGSNAPERANQLKGLGYEVLLFCDSDKDITPGEDELKKSCIEVVKWDDSLNTEQRVCYDIPIEYLENIIIIAKEIKGEQSVLYSIKSNLEIELNDDSKTIDDWIKLGKSEQVIRKAISKAAIDGEWFKNIDNGYKLGELIKRILPKILDSDLYKKLSEIENWIYVQANNKRNIEK